MMWHILKPRYDLKVIRLNQQHTGQNQGNTLSLHKKSRQLPWMATFRRQFAACVAYVQNNKAELLFLCLFCLVVPSLLYPSVFLCGCPLEGLLRRNWVADAEKLFFPTGSCCLALLPLATGLCSTFQAQPSPPHSLFLHAFLLPGNLGSLSTQNQLGKGGWFLGEGEGGEEREDIWLHGNKPCLAS